MDQGRNNAISHSPMLLDIKLTSCNSKPYSDSLMYDKIMRHLSLKYKEVGLTDYMVISESI